MNSRLSRAIILLAFLLIFLRLSPGPVKAATQTNIKIGTHLIQADPGAEQKVLDKLSSQGSLPEPYPVVMMLDAENPSNYSALADALNNTQKYSTIVRVNITATTDPAKMAAVAEFLNAKLPNAAVTLGNEINNQDPTNGEWKSTSYTNYAALFNALASALSPTHPLGISTVDTINSIYDAGIILPQILNSGLDKTKITAVFANVYQTGDCPSGNDRCTVKSGDWVLAQFAANGINISSNNLYITEFGITSCTDLNCIQNFYKTNASINAKAVVGFSRNPGQTSGSDWIHTIPATCSYIPYNNLSNIEHPTSCTGISGNSYLYPGIEDQTGPVQMLKEAANYILTCGPKLSFTAKIQNEDLINKSSPGFTSYNLDCTAPGSCTIPNVAGQAFVNHEQSTIPLFRMTSTQTSNNNSSSRRLSDLEGFFSAINTSTSVFDNYVNNGSTTKMMSPQVKCENTLQFLEAINNLCKGNFKPTVAVNNPKLLSPSPTPTSETPTRCALDLTLSNSSESFLDVWNSKPVGFSCNTSDSNFEYKYKLSLIETTTPKAFKPAYIVHYVNAPVKDPDIIDKLANWLAPEGNTSEEKVNNRIKITKVYVPANFASSSTDQLDIPQTRGNTSFNSNFVNSVSSLLPTQTTNYVETKLKTTVDDIFSRSSASNMTNPDATNESYLRCPECNQEDFIGIIVKRINAEVNRKNVVDGDNLDCQKNDIAGEKAVTIKSPLNADGNPDPIKEIAMPARATLKAKASDEKELAMRTYMLLPQEYGRLYEYENQFASVLLPQTYSASLNWTSAKPTATDKNGSAYKFLQLSDTAPKGGNSGLTVHLSSSEVKGAVVGTTVAGPVSLTGTIDSADTSSFDVNPLIPGGKLARSLWEYVCHVMNAYPDKKLAPYTGIEKLLLNGSKACYASSSIATTQAPTSSASSVACPGPKLSSEELLKTPSDYSRIINCDTNAQLNPDQQQWARLKATSHYVVNRIVSIADPRSAGNRIDLCFNDVVKKSLAAGINPIYTLAIWTQESGASNYLRFGGNVQDFGINTTTAMGFNAQLTYFLNLPYSYPNGNSQQCFKNGCSVENFSQLFKYGNFDANCGITDTSYAEKTISNMKLLAPNCDIPAYPTQMTTCR